MYDQIEANKRKTIFLMVGFFMLAAGIAWLIGGIFADFRYTVFALIFSVFYALWSYFASAKLALALNGAHEINKEENIRLWRVVENIAITDGLPMPKVYIIEDQGANAFATGRDPRNSVVAVTTGLLALMDDNELKGVIAHEMGHIKNYDIRVSMVAFALVTVISLLCDLFLRMSFYGGKDDDNNSNGYVMILGFAALIIAPIAASMLQLAISRKREYLADATGALTTRYPEGLASALEKLMQNGSTLRRQNTSTAHLFFANPLKGKGIAQLFSTHPPLEDRIKRLRAMGI
jgi:heat shock protein HtpX